MAVFDGNEATLLGKAENSIAVVCHKLRTPLTAAMGFLQLALRDENRADNNTRVALLEMADEQLRRLSSLIDEYSNTR